MILQPIVCFPHVGLAFEHYINSAELLRRLVAEARSSRARPLRLAAHRIDARGRSAKGIHQLEGDDISQRGMKVRHDGTFRPGFRVCVQLPRAANARASSVGRRNSPQACS
jgi:hypothetical protein